MEITFHKHPLSNEVLDHKGRSVAYQARKLLSETNDQRSPSISGKIDILRKSRGSVLLKLLGVSGLSR